MKVSFSIARLGSAALACVLALSALALAAQAQALNKPEIFVQTGHSLSVYSVAWSPDGTMVASAGADRTVQLWDVATGKTLRILAGHSFFVQGAAFTRDGARLVSAGGNSIRFWDVKTGALLREFKANKYNDYMAGNYSSMAISPDERIVAAGIGGNVELWDAKAGTNSVLDAGGRTCMALAWSPDGKILVSTSHETSKPSVIKVWAIPSGKLARTLNETDDMVSALACSPDSALLASGGYTQTKIWNLATGALVVAVDTVKCATKSLLFSSDGSCLYEGNEAAKEILLRSPTGLSATRSIAIPAGPDCIALSADGASLLVGTKDYLVRSVNIADGSPGQVFSGTARMFNSLALSPDGTMLATGGYFQGLRLWDPKKGRQLRQLLDDTKRVSSVEFSPDGASIAAAGDGLVSVWETATWKLLFQVPGPRYGKEYARFSKDGKLLASSDGSFNVKLWDARTGSLVRTLEWPESYIDGVYFVPDGRLLTAASRSARLWDTGTGEAVWTMPKSDVQVSATSVLFPPDGKSMIFGSVDLVSVYDLAAAKYQRYYKGHKGYIQTMALSPDGKSFVSGGFVGETAVYLQDIAGDTAKKLFDHDNSVTGLAYSPDGAFLYSASHDCTLRVWDMKKGAEICRFVAFEGGEWICLSPDGYFNASANGARNMNIRLGQRVYSIDNFFDAWFRPDIVQARLLGTGARPAALASASALAASAPPALPTPPTLPTPPSIRIQVQTEDGSFAEPRPGLKYRISEGQVAVKAVGRDSGDGVEGLRLYLNGKVVGENGRGLAIAASASGLELSLQVALQDGENAFRAVAWGKSRSESNPAQFSLRYAKPVPAKPDMYILAIGVNSYRNGRYNLGYCVADASAFLDSLRPRAAKLFGSVEVQSLYDQDATRAKVLAALASIRGRARAEDVFVFYYAGHGIALQAGAGEPEFYYVLRDVVQMTDPARCAADGLSATELRGCLKELKPAKQVMFIDACNSGAFVEKFASRGAAEENALAKLGRATGSAVFAAAGGSQAAAESKELNHGVFTYVLVDSLAGAAIRENGELSLARIRENLDEKVPALTLKYDGEEQWPISFIFGQDFPLGLK